MSYVKEALKPWRKWKRGDPITDEMANGLPVVLDTAGSLEPIINLQGQMLDILRDTNVTLNELLSVMKLTHDDAHRTARQAVPEYEHEEE